MLTVARKRLANLPSWVFWASLGFVGLMILVFNDVFGDDDHFIVFSLFYFLFLGVSVVRWIFRQIKAVIALRRDKAKMEMLHLKSQVNPHFFFNTLNNLYGLVDKNPKEAQNLILKLSDLMRYSIYEGQNDWVSLEDEIEYLKNYIEIQKDRYHKVVDIDFNVSTIEKNAKIMPLLLILLVENAFKHGVEKLIKNAFVKINISTKEGQINFNIENNYDLEQENDNQPGIGIANLKRRLQIGYQKNYKLSMKKESGIYKADLVLKKI